MIYNEIHNQNIFNFMGIVYIQLYAYVIHTHTHTHTHTIIELYYTKKFLFQFSTFSSAVNPIFDVTSQKWAFRVSWVVLSVKHQALAQVIISLFMSSNPMSISVLTAQSLEPASDSMSLSLSLCPSPTHSLSLCLSLSRINKH